MSISSTSGSSEAEESTSFIIPSSRDLAILISASVNPNSNNLRFEFAVVSSTTVPTVSSAAFAWLTPGPEAGAAVACNPEPLPEDIDDIAGAVGLGRVTGEADVGDCAKGLEEAFGPVAIDNAGCEGAGAGVCILDDAVDAEGNGWLEGAVIREGCGEWD